MCKYFGMFISYWIFKTNLITNTVNKMHSPPNKQKISHLWLDCHKCWIYFHCELRITFLHKSLFSCAYASAAHLVSIVLVVTLCRSFRNLKESAMFDSFAWRQSENILFQCICTSFWRKEWYIVCPEMLVTIIDKFDNSLYV